MMKAARSHVGVNGAEGCPLGDRADPPVRCAAVKSLAVSAAQDRPGGPLADGKVDRACGAGHDGDDGGLVALPDDPEGAVSSFEPEVLDVGGAGLAHPEAVQAQEDGEGGVGVVEALGGEQERSKLGAVEAASVVGVDLGVPDVLGGVGGDPAVDVGEPVEAADSGQAPVDRGGGEASCLHGPHVELDLRTAGLQDFKSSIGGPLEEPRRSVR